MNIVAYLRHNDSRTNERVLHFGRALGARFSTREKPVECDLAIQAGFQISPAMKDAMDRGIPLIILENPVWHYGDKSSTYTWGYNGLNNLGWAPSVDSKEIRPHPALEPWRDHTAGTWTIFGQVENDKSLRGLDIHEWVKEKKALYHEAEFRPHPFMLSAQEMVDQECIYDCMARTSLAVTYNSTVGAETVMRGIPTLVDHIGGWAYSMSGIDHPDRTKWVHELSWRHWSSDEEIDRAYIINGYEEALDRAQKGLYDNMSNGRDQ